MRRGRGRIRGATRGGAVAPPARPLASREGGAGGLPPPPAPARGARARRYRQTPFCWAWCASSRSCPPPCASCRPG